jgi:hypothetical protein
LKLSLILPSDVFHIPVQSAYLLVQEGDTGVHMEENGLLPLCGIDVGED